MDQNNGQNTPPQAVARSINPAINEAISYLDSCVSRAALSRQEHLAASQMVQRLTRYCENAEQEITALKVASVQISRSASEKDSKIADLNMRLANLENNSGDKPQAEKAIAVLK